MRLLVLNVVDAYAVLFNSLKFNSQPNQTETQQCSMLAKAASSANSEKGVSPVTRTGPAERFMVDRNGGEITSSSGRIKVKIERELLDEAVYLDIVENTDPAFAIGPAWGHAFEIMVEGVSGRKVQNGLLDSLQIEYLYDPAEFSGKEDGIRLFIYTEKLHTWLMMPGHADPQARRVVGQPIR